MCLDAQHRIHSAQIDLKSDATQVLIGVISTAVIHYIFEKYIFRVKRDNNVIILIHDSH